MNNTINTFDVSEAEPIWLTVARLSAGFHRMAQLAQEIVELDGVRQDNARTHAMIRRDVASAVLQNAIALKKHEKATVYVEAAAVDEMAPALSPPQSDEWASRLVRWADQFGRDLFKLPSLLLTAKKHGDDKSNSSGPD